jgi:L-amino acid N-acyltransferase YncA
MEDKYLYMIRKAQEFMNENHFADVSRVQCLLRKMMSKEYHVLIDQIKECQDPHVIFNIHGGNNLIAPNASQAEQKVVEKPADELKNKIRNNQERRPMDLQVQRFSDIDLNDSFFGSLRASYPEFNEWYNKKAAAGATAYCYYVDNELKDFLYLKIEEEELSDLTPALPAKKRLKVGTFKVDNEDRHTTRGERFMKKIMDKAIAEDVDEIYVTMFPTEELQGLIRMFEKFGFSHIADKPHEGGNVEYVLIKDMTTHVDDFKLDYPFVKKASSNKYVLSIVPEFHTHLFPDSILKNEKKYDLIQDVSETNSIYKIYLCWMQDTRNLKAGDKLIIYRTSDEEGKAYYRSVCTSVCTVCEVKTYRDFENEEEFIKYTNRYSVFKEHELRRWYKNKNYFIVIKMVYNIAFTKKVINMVMKEQVGLNPKYWGFFKLSDAQFDKLLELGEIDERYIID